MRKNMVTRTIKSTRVVALVTDLVEETTRRAEFVIPRTYEAPEVILKVVKKLYNSDILTVNKILSTQVDVARYGMDEADFIKVAKVLPLREAGESEKTDE